MRFSTEEFIKPPAEFSPSYFWVLNDLPDYEQLRGQLQDMAAHGLRSVCVVTENRSPEFMGILNQLVEECQHLEMNFWLYGSAGSDQAPGMDTAAFLEASHGRSAEVLEAAFGETIKFAFTDAPQVGRIDPASSAVAEEFLKIFGAPVASWLPPLTQKPLEDEEEELTRARIALKEARSRVFVKHYLAPLQEWCHAHGLRSGGHFDNHVACENIAAVQKYLDIPGVYTTAGALSSDAEYRESSYHASSAARQYHDGLALAEIGCGSGAGFTWEQYRRLCSAMFIRSIPLILTGIYPQSQHEGRFWEFPRPQVGAGDPRWRYSNAVHLWTSRMAYLTSVGKSDNHTAVYFPNRDLWAGGKTAEQARDSYLAIAKYLETHQNDFDCIDDDTLANCEFEDGNLVVGDCAYRTLILPDCRWMSPEADAACQRFTELGGALLKADVVHTLTPLLATSHPAEALRVTKRVTDDGCAFYLLYNDSPDVLEVTLQISESAPMSWCNPNDGRLYAIETAKENPGAVTAAFGAYEFKVLATNLEAEDENPDTPGDLLMELLPQTIQPLRHYAFNPAKGWRVFVDSQPPLPAHLGDWSTTVGDNFSGDVLYRFTCEAEENCDVILDLGTVRHAATVQINDDAPVHLPWSPYRLTGRLRKGVNSIAVCVTNTLANCVLDPQFEERNQPSAGTPQRILEEASVPSGLFDPLRIYTRK